MNLQTMIARELKKINLNCPVLRDVPLAPRNTFEVGGPAEVFLEPSDREDLRRIVRFCSLREIPLLVLGGGSNVLISDQGIPGVVVCTTALKKIRREKETLILESGVSVQEASLYAWEEGLTGLEFCYGLPGTAGGAVWMNARCYGREFSRIFVRAEVLDLEGEIGEVDYHSEDWAYKESPFRKQFSGWTILEIRLRLKRGGGSKEARTLMESYYEDREKKGHFRAPCAGSYFKNNYAYGRPTGAILDDLGLKGTRKGGARLAPWHGNIIIKAEPEATARDIFDLGLYLKSEARKAGYDLEEEVQRKGNWR